MTSIASPGLTIGATSDTTRRRSHTHTVASQTHADSSLADRSRRLELVRQHGDFFLAYPTAVQPNLKHFGDELGYLAYGQRCGYQFVLGDPVAAPQHRQRLIQRFVAEHPRAAFCQISAATAEMVQQCGFYVNEMGVDTVLPLPEYNLQGGEKRWLRAAELWTSNRGCTVREATTEQVGADRIEAVSLAWRATRTVKRREVGFLNRPLVIADEPGTRRFYFFDATQQMLAFVFFDPLYRDGQLIGYAACSKRRHPDAPSVAEQAIMKRAIDVFQREGCQELRMGLSPLAWIEDRDYRFHWLLHKTFRCGFSARWVNKLFYNVQGHAAYKRRFRGREEKLYFATRAKFNALRLMHLIKLCKLV